MYLVFLENTINLGRDIPKEELLWENQSPTSSFSATTFDFDITNFDYLRIVNSAKATTTTEPVSYIFAVSDILKYTTDKNNPLALGRRAETANYGRTIYSVGNNLRIFNSYSGATTDNAQAIPLAIYGIRRK